MYRHEIDEHGKTLKLWVRRKRGNRKLVCSGCGRKLTEACDIYQREVRDLPWSEYRTTVVIELYRVRCPDCGVKTEKVTAVAQQGAVQQALRRGGGAGLRECSGATGGAAVWAGGQHGARHRSALSGALGGGTQEAGLAADGRGRDSSGEEAEVPHRGEQPGDRRTVVVWAGTEEGDAGSSSSRSS